MTEFSARLKAYNGQTVLITSQVMGPYFEQHPRMTVTPTSDLPSGFKKHHERAFVVEASTDVDVLAEARAFGESLRHVFIYPIILREEDTGWKGMDASLRKICWHLSPQSASHSDLAWDFSVITPDYVSDAEVIDLVVSKLAEDGYRGVCAMFDDVYVLRVHRH